MPILCVFSVNSNNVQITFPLQFPLQITGVVGYACQLVNLPNQHSPYFSYLGLYADWTLLPSRIVVRFNPFIFNLAKAFL